MAGIRHIAKGLRGLAVLALALPLACAPASAQQPDELSLELIDPRVLRVCADPGNMPFSNDKEEGFENRIAELLASKLGKSVSYAWFPQAIGFVRNTLGAHTCDVVIGYAQGDELVQNTNPYYRTAYALIYKPGQGLDGVETLSDPRLAGKRVGVVAQTPPVNLLLANGLIERARAYPLLVDTRIDSSARDMTNDIASGEIDAGVLWGPMAGYFGKNATPPLTVVPLVKETKGPRMAFQITMGVRASDQEWKRALNRLIRENRAEIDKILLDYGVPLLNDQNERIGAP
ncbi:substrate-binding domain-containing protein [Terrihabitans sp. B22-R8]|uniref:substrate-binding domain-containing protein n=1 Tax=Terrihabitans sp. B22-R8 TaxID=3425128 RepID=UPI00403C3E35